MTARPGVLAPQPAGGVSGAAELGVRATHRRGQIQRVHHGGGGISTGSSNHEVEQKDRLLIKRCCQESPNIKCDKAA